MTENKKCMTLAEITNYLQDWCHHGFADREVIFEDNSFKDFEIKEVAVFEAVNLQGEKTRKLMIKFY